MKAKIAIAVSALILGTITTANADLYIQSPSGVTQEQWNQTDAYKNFTCPDGYGRAEGVDLNWTANRADDFYYVSCNAIILPPSTTALIPSTPEPTPQPTAISETSTATVTLNATAPVSSNTPTVVSNETTTVTDTTTAKTASTTIDSLYAQIMALFTQLLALIAKLQG